MDDAPKAILIVGPAWVGDMVMAQSLFKFVKSRHPDAAIDVIAPAWSRSLLERMPEVREALSLPFGHGDFKLLARMRLGASLKNRRYDWAIVMPITWKSALVPYGAKILRRSGYIGEMRWGLLNDLRTMDKAERPMMVQRYIDLALNRNEPAPDSFPYPQLVVDASTRDRAISDLKLDTSLGPIIAFCPGAEYGPAKRWPSAYFNKVAEEYINKGWQVWIFGSGKERALGEEIRDKLDSTKIRNLAGETSLAQAIDLLSVADAVLSNDSGLMHVAAALDRKVYALYGSSDTRYTPPLNDSAQCISLNLVCSPCFKRECPLGHTNCLMELTPEKVLAEMAL